MKNRSKFLCVVAGAIALACAAAPIAIARASGAQQDAGHATTKAQAPQTGAQDPVQDPRFAQFVYDVVSIKLNKAPSSGSIMGHPTADGFSMKAMPFSWVISRAYLTAHSQLSDSVPGWLRTEAYDVEAKMAPEVADALQKLSPADQILARRHMIRALLRDRLKLEVHVETKEIPTYDLVVGKNGPKMKETTDPAKPIGGGVHMGPGGTIVTDWQNTPISNMVARLSIDVGRPVYDKTGLTGHYSFTLTYTPEQQLTVGATSDPPPDSAPPLAKAIEEQLGLKLVPAKGPMDYIVIDHVERPSPN